VTLDFAEAGDLAAPLPVDAGVISGRLTLVTKPGVVDGTDDMELREEPGAMGSRSACHLQARSAAAGLQQEQAA